MQNLHKALTIPLKNPVYLHSISINPYKIPINQLKIPINFKNTSKNQYKKESHTKSDTESPTLSMVWISEKPGWGKSRHGLKNPSKVLINPCTSIKSHQILLDPYRIPTKSL